MCCYWIHYETTLSLSCIIVFRESKLTITKLIYLTNQHILLLIPQQDFYISSVDTDPRNCLIKEPGFRISCYSRQRSHIPWNHVIKRGHGDNDRRDTWNCLLYFYIIPNYLQLFSKSAINIPRHREQSKWPITMSL